MLLEALMDPSTKTAPCLQVLLQTSFVHFIDAPSLALIMPVLQRALSERSTETKKMASQIIGNMYSLTDKKVGRVTSHSYIQQITLIIIVKGSVTLLYSIPLRIQLARINVIPRVVYNGIFPPKCAASVTVFQLIG